MARKSGRITYHVCIYSALMEYHSSKDAGIAGRVFDLSLKNFLDDPAQSAQVALTYLDHLLSINDETSISFILTSNSFRRPCGV